MSTRDASTAVKRFGLGAKFGELAKVSGDPRGFVLGQLSRRKDATLLVGPDLEPSRKILLAVAVATANDPQRQARKAQKAAGREAMAARNGKAGEEPAMADAGPAASPSSMGEQATMAGAQPMAVPTKGMRGALVKEYYRDDAAARFERGAGTDDAFLERLVMFWSNHFCVSMRKVNVRPVVGAFEREAIRPHVLGRFVDMLLAVTRHPAMLFYLDNNVSSGPNSSFGKNRKRGLNENLAREILELHTLGVDGGYTQADVTNLARIITGWTVHPPRDLGADAGTFHFSAAMHEPGKWPLLGRSYGDDGEKAGEAALRDLARHPSTAKHIAKKLAQHFVADNPPPALVERLAASFRSTDGNLAELARLLVSADEAWAAPASKIVPPYDFLVAIMRGFKVTPPDGELVRLANALGQPMWGPPSPKGWPDANEAWLSASGLNERLRVAERAAQIIDRDADPRGIAENLLGTSLSAVTREAIDRAEAREQGLHLLIMSPEFQRR